MRSPQENRFLLLLSMQVIIGGLIVFLFIFIRNTQHDLNLDSSTSSGQSQAINKELGNILMGYGLLEEAAQSYETYLYSKNIDHIQKSNYAFTLGEIFREQGQLEKAIKYFTLVKLFLKDVSPNQKGFNKDLIQDAEKNIVALLERLNKTGAAKMVLDQATTLNKSVENSKNEISTRANDQVVIAQIGTGAIYKYQFEESYDQLPENVKSQFKDKAGKLNYLKKFIADKLVLEKARRLNLENDSKIKNQLHQIKEQLLIQQILKSEILDKIKIDEQDVKNYYQSHFEDFNSKGSKPLPFEKVKAEVYLKYRQNKEGLGYQKLIEDLLKNEKVQIYEDKI
jgi:hypothetical protein